MDSTTRYRPIGDYALIGDARTAALVGRDGSIDWYCPSRFDSGAVFCRLLDGHRGGYLQVAPTGDFQSQRSYLGATNVLATEFRTATGSARVVDFMPMVATGDGVQHPRILRLVEGLSGEVDVQVRFRPTFDYARAATRLTVGAGGAVAKSERESLWLACPALMHVDGEGVARSALRVHTGARQWLVLTSGPETAPGPPVATQDDAEKQLRATLAFWEHWSERCTYAGPYRALVQRSALVLKLLTYGPTGALVAAPTTSLPEQVGGVRNWDYRFTWSRDSGLILSALLQLGYHDEAMAFWTFLEGVSSRQAEALQIMYAVDGRSELPERELPHLEGYKGSRPVRIGNAASQQTQNDIYGAVLDAADYCHAHMVQEHPDGFWRMVSSGADAAAERWRDPDQGIWEVRGPPRHFLHSKLMCWVALDRAVRLSERSRRFAAHTLDRWRAEADAVKSAILHQGFHSGRGAFTQSFDSEALDASALLIPLVGLLPARDWRVAATTQAVEKELTNGGLIYRYRADDGLPGSEATFALCSFWLVDVLALQGLVDRAEALYRRVLSYANDVGLLAEQVDPTSGELLGNFPQGFSHLAVIRSALVLQRADADRRA